MTLPSVGSSRRCHYSMAFVLANTARKYNPMNTILITGAASGIGRASAERFYKAGWCVGLFDISAQPLAELSRSWQPERFRIQVTDVTQEEQIGAAIDRFVEDVGKLDVLFNCAGVLEIGDFESIPLRRHHQILDINNKGDRKSVV